MNRWMLTDQSVEAYCGATHETQILFAILIINIIFRCRMYIKLYLAFYTHNIVVDWTWLFTAILIPLSDYKAKHSSAICSLKTRYQYNVNTFSVSDQHYSLCTATVCTSRSSSAISILPNRKWKERRCEE